jgi:hypothetical protein
VTGSILEIIVWLCPGTTSGRKAILAVICRRLPGGRGRIIGLVSRLCKRKSKAVPLHAMEALGGEYSSYSFSTSVLGGGKWSASRPSRALPPGKGPPVTIVQEAGWAPEPVWTQRLEENPLPLPGIEPRSPGRPVRSQILY